MAADALESRMGYLEGAFQQMDKRLGSIEGRMGAIESGMDSLERAVQAFRLEAHADLRDLRSELRSEMREQFRWMLGLMVVAILSPAIVRLLLR